ncbi:MAG: 50S ribosomal protein L17 [bacterium]|nr:50S ribosomal protein L17 [bacterium]
MSDQKRFKKSKINSDDHKAMEIGAKVVKGAGSVLVASVLLVTNKENLKTAGKVAAKVIKKL